jgi:ubiquinol-cytochrome c reductase cytochrome b subunit
MSKTDRQRKPPLYPLGINAQVDKISFYPYFYVKDLVGWVAFAIFFGILVFYAPNLLGHPDNYIGRP